MRRDGHRVLRLAGARSLSQRATCAGQLAEPASIPVIRSAGESEVRQPQDRTLNETLTRRRGVAKRALRMQAARQSLSTRTATLGSGKRRVAIPTVVASGTGKLAGERQVKSSNSAALAPSTKARNSSLVKRNAGVSGDFESRSKIMSCSRAISTHSVLAHLLDLRHADGPSAEGDIVKYPSLVRRIGQLAELGTTNYELELRTSKQDTHVDCRHIWYSRWRLRSLS